MESTRIFILKSQENLKAARICLDNEMFNASASRSYYSAAQAAAALLFSRGRLPSGPNHDKIRYAFIQLWRDVHGNEPKINRVLPMLFALRREADYGEKRISKRQASDAHIQSAEFINKIIRGGNIR